mmetsp:Transcript_9042/g.22106  ORF Transcript_9042/g.22106 Transcript_9042/m.22106 type:complete len:277 (+) Transcript_9042:1819-2649(+)
MQFAFEQLGLLAHGVRRLAIFRRLLQGATRNTRLVTVELCLYPLDEGHGAVSRLPQARHLLALFCHLLLNRVPLLAEASQLLFQRLVFALCLLIARLQLLQVVCVAFFFFFDGSFCLRQLLPEGAVGGDDFPLREDCHHRDFVGGFEDASVSLLEVLQERHAKLLVLAGDALDLGLDVVHVLRQFEGAVARPRIHVVRGIATPAAGRTSRRHDLLSLTLSFRTSVFTVCFGEVHRLKRALVARMDELSLCHFAPRKVANLLRLVSHLGLDGRNRPW